jgi:hypothetical protein
MKQYEQNYTEQSLSELVSDQSECCRYCGQRFLTSQPCARHESKCEEAEDRSTRPAHQADRAVVVDAETYYTVGTKPEAYHVDEDCERAAQSIAAGQRTERPPDETRLVERSRRYVEWHDLDACHECVSVVDSCASVQQAASADD